jgi:putative transcriptional regulator
VVVSWESLEGRLLVAAPTMYDSNFDRTVVLVLEHSGEGALGLVLNRPSDDDVFSALPRWDSLAAEPAVIFSGGPVSPGAAICLARAEGAEVEGWKPLFDGLGTVDLDLDPADLGVAIQKVRVFAGYSGWGPGQLDAEVDQGGWFVLDRLPSDALSGEPETLWEAVLRRQEGNLALVANFPPDVSVN